MFPDDVFRQRLDDTIKALEAWAADTRDAATIDIASQPTYWRMTVSPEMPGAAPFQLLLTAGQRFSLKIAAEIYEDKPIDRFDFFLMLVRAIRDGAAARIETTSTLTGALESVETRIELEDGWAWIGERRVGARAPRRQEPGLERRTYRFLPYRRRSAR